MSPTSDNPSNHHRTLWHNHSIVEFKLPQWKLRLLDRLTCSNSRGGYISYVYVSQLSVGVDTNETSIRIPTYKRERNHNREFASRRRHRRDQDYRAVLCNWLNKPGHASACVPRISGLLRVSLVYATCLLQRYIYDIVLIPIYLVYIYYIL